jgi:hypothetical protein
MYAFCLRELLDVHQVPHTRMSFILEGVGLTCIKDLPAHGSLSFASGRTHSPSDSKFCTNQSSLTGAKKHV